MLLQPKGWRYGILQPKGWRYGILQPKGWRYGLYLSNIKEWRPVKRMGVTFSFQARFLEGYSTPAPQVADGGFLLLRFSGSFKLVNMADGTRFPGFPQELPGLL